MWSPPSRRMPRPVEISLAERPPPMFAAAPCPSPAARQRRDGAGQGSRFRPASGSAQFHQARQESRERLACTRGRDQQHRAAGTRFRQEFELMLARRPASAGEPMQEWLGKREGRVRRCLDIHDRRTTRALIGCRLFRHNALTAVESGMMCPIISLPIQASELTVGTDLSRPEPVATTTRLGTGAPFSLRVTAWLSARRLRPASAIAVRTCAAP